MLLLGLAACAGRNDDWTRIQDAGVLRVGMDASFPPFEMVGSDGAVAGFDVDLARELGRRMGLEVQFTANLPTDGLYDALAVGRADVVISALVINPDKLADVAYSTPYFDAGQVLVVRRGTPSPQGMEDLAGRTIAVEFGALGDQTARAWARRLSDLVVVKCQTAPEALALVAAGEADAALVDHVSALNVVGAGNEAAGQHAALEIAGDPVVEEPYAAAVLARNRLLLRAINRALAQMRTDGTLDALETRWLASATSRAGLWPAADSRPSAQLAAPRRS